MNINNTVMLSIKERLAFALAIEHHNNKYPNSGDGQKRKLSGVPYEVHLLEVWNILNYIGANLPTKIAGILHDIFEDTNCTEDEVREMFGEEVLQIILADSEGNKTEMTREEKSANWMERKQKTVNEMKNLRIESILILFADKLSNLVETNQFCKDKDMFNEKFNSTPEQMFWYLNSVRTQSLILVSKMDAKGDYYKLNLELASEFAQQLTRFESMFLSKSL
jgi:(p)ppGpp synthase/HD superfamily hydrolase